MNLNTILNKFQTGQKKKSYKELKIYIEKNPGDLIAIYNFAYMSELLSKKDEATSHYIYLNKKDPKNSKMN